MGKLIKVDFSPKGKELYRMGKELSYDHKHPLSTLQKIEEIFKKQVTSRK